MCEEQELETAFGTAACYRRLWLSSEHALAEIEIILADALGVQATPTPQSLHAMALAEATAYRLREMEKLQMASRHRKPRRSRNGHSTNERNRV